MKILLGTGQLGWMGYERRSDRYGTVSLFGYDDNNKPENDIMKLIMKDYIGKKGKLYVKILEVKTSHHIGDLFRGLIPEKPKLYEIIELGTGTLFIENENGTLCIGVKPDDGRETDWLNPKNLYRCHDQIVDLYFDYMGE